jgi:pyruvate formate lyase activating enzyme
MKNDERQPETLRRWATLPRRAAIACGVTGCAGLAGAASWFSWFRKTIEDVAPADIFKGDAPSDKVWDAWRQRGWVKEASHYLKLGRNVQCKVCPNNCLLTPGDRSHCRNKINRDGTLYTMAYANPCSMHVDPIEKKPLFHFLPGSRSFSLATSGCVFRCLNCQNWEISQKKPEETKDATGPEFRFKPPLPEAVSMGDNSRLSLFPEDIAQVAKTLGCPSISYTYSEPTAYYEYAADCCKAARAAKVKNVLVTCGSIEERSFRDLAQHVDAAHVDLKGFNDEVYRKLNSGKLEPILRTLKIYRELGIWFEVINLIVPTYTDELEMIRRMCGWMAENLGPDTPLHFSRFHPQHKLTHLPPTPVDTLVKARDTARAAGLRYVYLGNVRGVPGAETTFCPNCKRAVVERDIFAVTASHLDAGACKFCRTKIAGVWAA